MAWEGEVGERVRGAFATLEDQMCGFTTDFDRQRAGYSPDRVDALVWSLTDLLVEQMSNEGIYEFYRREAAALAARKLAEEKKGRPEPTYQPGSLEYAEQQRRRDKRGAIGRHCLDPFIARGPQPRDAVLVLQTAALFCFVLAAMLLAELPLFVALAR